MGILTFLSGLYTILLRLSLPLDQSIAARNLELAEKYPLFDWIFINAASIFKIIFLVTLFFSLSVFYKSYNFITSIVNQVVTEIRPDVDEDGQYRLSLKELLGTPYRKLKRSINICVTAWIIQIALVVVFLS